MPASVRLPHLIACSVMLMTLLHAVPGVLLLITPGAWTGAVVAATQLLWSAGLGLAALFCAAMLGYEVARAFSDRDPLRGLTLPPTCTPAALRVALYGTAAGGGLGTLLSQWCGIGPTTAALMALAAALNSVGLLVLERRLSARR